MPTTLVCAVVVPPTVAATGVPASKPASISAAVVSFSTSAAFSSTRVCFGCSREKSSLASARSRTVTSRSPFIVSGIPAYAGTALTSLTPGITLKPIPALRQATASSAPLEKVNGSPVSRRTTFAEALAVLTTRRARAATFSARLPSAPDPSMISTPGLQ